MATRGHAAMANGVYCKMQVHRRSHEVPQLDMVSSHRRCSGSNMLWPLAVPTKPTGSEQPGDRSKVKINPRFKSYWKIVDAKCAPQLVVFVKPGVPHLGGVIWHRVCAIAASNQRGSLTEHVQVPYPGSQICTQLCHAL